MDRDSALLNARLFAKDTGKIVVMFQGKPGEYHYDTYDWWSKHGVSSVSYDDTTRYILPNGEVTKLS